MASSTPERFFFVDVLRGVAAVAVCVFHWSGYSEGENSIIRTQPLIESLVSYGWMGVEIFFVLSGFVITHSLRHLPFKIRHIGNFILRRHIRLDLLYWSVLILTWVLLHHPLSGVEPFDPASWRALLINIVYLQNITEARGVLGVAWTLCLEVQFYLFFISLIGLYTLKSRWKRPVEAAGEKHWSELGWVVFGTGALPLVFGLKFATFNGWFIQWWPFFALGCLGYLAAQKIMTPWPFLLLSIMMLACPFAYSLRENGWQPLLITLNYLVIGSVGSLTALLLLWFCWHPGWVKWEKQRLPLLFGNVSYSLYLTHMLTLQSVIDLTTRYVIPPFFKTVAWWGALGLTFPIACLAYRWIEKPTRQMSSRLKLKSGGDHCETKPQGAAIGEFMV